MLKSDVNRREFLTTAAYGVSATWLGSNFTRPVWAMPGLDKKFSAADLITLGSTGIKTSRLAMGTGTVGVGHHSHQTALGLKGLSDLLLNGYDKGLRFFDAADSYGSHPHVAEALKHVERDKVTVLTKSWARDPDGMRADIERFRKELGTEYIDVLLMHCLTEGDWTERYKGVMEVLSEAKQKGIIRAHGCSCHSIEALRAAAESPWVEVDLARINPTGVNQLAMHRGIDWFRRNVITKVPFPHPGMMRDVYPGFLQLHGFMSMNLDRHIEAHHNLFLHLVKGDGDSAQKHREFYDEYLAVMDLAAEFYLQTVDTVFIRHALPKGEMMHRSRRVDPAAIRRVALMTVEGENDDISSVGQTEAAHALCVNIPDEDKVHYLQPSVGHYGVFNGSRFRAEIAPRIADFVLSRNGTRAVRTPPLKIAAQH